MSDRYILSPRFRRDCNKIMCAVPGAPCRSSCCSVLQVSSELPRAVTTLYIIQTFSILSVEAVDALQLLHQLDVVLLGGRRGDLIFDSDFLPCIVLVLLLYATAHVSQQSS